ncbi:hypothetical protein [Methanothermobacter sp. THM-1]|uniref:hypothetical protein n=1 Tax=Methanothermobacter sp. THM-1 TaxID=2606911 RepID=UPI00192D7A61|nr:hypothetical protein [Methanothermobacter sp. THM-1]
MIDRDALLEFLGISSGGGSGSSGGGDGGGGGSSSHWRLLKLYNFEEPINSFNFQVPTDLDVLKLEYAVRVTWSAGEGHFRILFNNDDNKSNYSSIMHYINNTSMGHGRNYTWPFEYPFFARIRGAANEIAMNVGHVLITLKPGMTRVAVNDNRMICEDFMFWGVQIGSWNDLTSTVDSIYIKSRDGTLTGKVAVYGW